MFCIKCFNPSTQVVNSRPQKRHPGVWRRRRCNNCGQIFTTDERPRVRDTQEVWDTSSNSSSAFNPGVLLISIANAFGHDPRRGQQVAWDLMETVIQILTVEFPDALSNDDIAAITHQVVERFDARAGLQYGLQHELLSAGTMRKRTK